MNLRTLVIILIFAGSPLAALPISASDAASGQPALPAGLGSNAPESGKPDEAAPPLPAGLQTDSDAPENDQEFLPPSGSGELPFDFGGFWELRFGFRTDEDPYQREVSLAETRLQLEIDKHLDSSSLELVLDLLLDPVAHDPDDFDLEAGTGPIDLRQLKYTVSPFGFMDVQAGRQILTWGTGDLLFLNDLFPKDYRSFFIGRDVEYLKAPSDALRVSLFMKRFRLPFNLDLVYTPRFDPDRFIDGERISYWNSSLGRRAGRDDILATVKPKRWFTDHELALRLYHNIHGYELALYGYRGYWKSPAGTRADTGMFYHPRLNVYGASIEGVVAGGIGNLEVAYYESCEDKDGTDPRAANSQYRILLGYEQEAAKNFTVGAQYYLEYMSDYDAYLHNLPAGKPAAEERRHVLTLRLTRQLMMQTLELSLFVFYSPSDEDAYLRPRISYDLDDNWRLDLGGNLFLADSKHTFFGQFENNSNVYLGLRYSF